MPDWVNELDTNPRRPRALPWEDYASRAVEDWLSLLDRDPHEAHLHGFLETNPSFIPGGEDRLPVGGHHGARWQAVYSQPPMRGLRRDRIPDFIWLNRNSAELTPVCVELERSGKHWFKANSTVPTAPFTQARDQLHQWQAWFATAPNEAIFREVYYENAWPHRALRPVYVLAYGRHQEFERPNERHDDPHSLLRHRSAMQGAREQFMSLDSLGPSKGLSNAVTLKMTAQGATLFAVPPTFETGPAMRSLAARFRDPSPALARTTGWLPGRREYVLERWLFWQKIADARHDGSPEPLDPGSE